MPERKARDRELKELLEKEKEKLFKGLFQDALFEKLGRDYVVEFQRGMDTGDSSVVEELQSVGLKLVDIRQDELSKVAAAERKLADGTYGICEDCGEEISEARLSAIVNAIYCIRCAEQREGPVLAHQGRY